jgi:hypothetical protein
VTSKTPSITVRYARTDDDVIAIHRFLCVVASPHLPGPIDPKKSIYEVWRVCNHEVALMAMRGNLMVGTLGLAQMSHWWGNVNFLANRWVFAIPGSRAWRPLLREAKAIAVASEMELMILSENRSKVIIINRSKLRDRPKITQEQAPALEASQESSPALMH